MLWSIAIHLANGTNLVKQARTIQETILMLSSLLDSTTHMREFIEGEKVLGITIAKGNSIVCAQCHKEVTDFMVAEERRDRPH